MKKRDENFESLYTQLEQIRTQLEAGDLPLEKSIELYEQGIRIYKECQKRLTAAERRIEVLTSDPEGNLQTEDFNTPSKPKEKSNVIPVTSTINEDYPDDEPTDDEIPF
ncbi:MAG: exodeoxyribonuclease VII small subunit [Pyrinomonadaceae bacterium]